MLIASFAGQARAQSTATSCLSAGGNGALNAEWTAAANAQGSDDLRASGKDAVGSDLQDYNSFGFTTTEVPVGSLIDGVELQIEGQSGKAQDAFDVTSQLVVGGAVCGNHENLIGCGGGCFAGNVDTAEVAGGPTNLWGCTISDSDVRASSFGVDLDLTRLLGGPGATMRTDDICLTVFFTPPVCGNGILEGTESCDNGAGNGTPGQCCSATCSLEAAATMCRGSAGLCDVAEFCDGIGPSCPADVVEPVTTECRASAGVCDAADFCDGASTTCGADLKLTSECRAAAGLCDIAESCDGLADTCPGDILEPVTSECRASAGPCDATDFCDGASTTCGADLKLTSECRAAAGLCDIAESCDGIAAACPTDAFDPVMTECRAALGFCDLAETCTGVGAACPSDVFKPATVGCRGPVGSCDVQENCTGFDSSCPADGFKPATAVCRPQMFACDVEEFCTGVGTFCPADATLNVGDPCDDADACTIGTQCLAGTPLVCAAGGSLDCDDGNACTAESCDSVTGCAHTVIPNCAAGVPATSSWSFALLALMFTMGGALLLERRRLGKLH